MWKGRTNRYGSAERLLHPDPVSHRHVAAAAADHLADLHEEDVWSVLTPAESNKTHRQRWARAGGLSVAFAGAVIHDDVAASSAPMKVPEWQSSRARSESDSDGGDDVRGEWVAPHKYLHLQQRSAAASSVLEGMGRTLKGRDLRRVRDAVWSNTGFFG